MWHGMPIKKIGIENGGLGLRTTYTLSTSKYFTNILAKSFGVNEESILNIGLPRNENIINPNKEFFASLTIPENHKVIFWLPTFRKSVIGEIRVDGTDFKNPFNLPNFNAEFFNEFLKRNNFICFFKPHPMAEIGLFESFSNFKIINDDFLYCHNITLYKALSITDFIVSDISSVVIDYLLLNKPIILSFADQESYENSRGLNSPDIITKPIGKICRSQDEITKELELLANGIDLYKHNREYFKKIFHDYVDTSKCTEILLRKIHII